MKHLCFRSLLSLTPIPSGEIIRMDFANTSKVVTAVVTLVAVALGCGFATGLYFLARYRQRQTKAHLAYGTGSPRSLPGTRYFFVTRIIAD